MDSTFQNAADPLLNGYASLNVSGYQLIRSNGQVASFSSAGVLALDGLVAHLTLDEATDDKAKKDKKAKNVAAGGKQDLGELKNGATFTNIGGGLGGAVSFDGVDDYVKVKKSDELNKDVLSQRTVSIWFQVDDKTVGDRKQVIYEEGSEAEGLNIYIDNGRLYVGGWNEPKDDKGKEGSWTGTYVWTDKITSGDWHHVALVLDAESGNYDVAPSTLLAYLDGENFGEGRGSQLKKDRDEITLGNVGKSTQFHDGDVEGKDVEGHGLGGQIADVQIYNQVLTANQIAALAGRSSTPTPSPIQFEVRSLDGSGNNLGNLTLGQAGTQYGRV
ncbi:MAG: LamG-like jellyroll fold domain-containing protein, partial [Thermosynechococcaceae cyanobacterium]